MTTTQWYVLPAESVEIAPGSTGYRPKHTGRDDVTGYGTGGCVDPPNGFQGTTTPNGEVYAGAVEAEQTGHDAMKTDPDVMAIPDDAAAAVLAARLNEKNRPQSASEAWDHVEQHTNGVPIPRDRESIDAWANRYTDMDEGSVRDLTFEEWAERLGVE